MTNAAPRLVLSADKVAPAAASTIGTFHRAFVDEVIAAGASERVVVVGMAQNPFVRRAHRALKKNAIAFKAIDHGSYLGGYRQRLAVKMWSGYPTFPQVFVNGTLIGGCTDLEALITAGGLRA